MNIEEQLNYIKNSKELRSFYDEFIRNFTTLLISSRIATSGLVEPKSGIFISTGISAVDTAQKVVGSAKSFIEDSTRKNLSLIYSKLSDIDRFAETFARKLAFRYENQIEQLTLSKRKLIKSITGGTQSFANCCASRVGYFLLANSEIKNLTRTQLPYSQIVDDLIWDCFTPVSIKGIPLKILPTIPVPKKITTKKDPENAKPNLKGEGDVLEKGKEITSFVGKKLWSDSGIIYTPGVITPDGKHWSGGLMKSFEKYGFRYGSMKEVEKFGLKEVTQTKWLKKSKPAKILLDSYGLGHLRSEELIKIITQEREERRKLETMLQEMKENQKRQEKLIQNIIEKVGMGGIKETVEKTKSKIKKPTIKKPRFGKK